MHPALNCISACLDVSDFIVLLSGDRNHPSIFDRVAYALHVKAQFSEIVEYLASLPQVRENKDLKVHIAFADQIFTSIKEGLESFIWGNNFPQIGSKMFAIVEEPLEGKSLNELMEDASLLQFSRVEQESFSLETLFEISMNTIEGNLIVKLLESEFYEALYTNKYLYSKIGREDCIIMDFV